MCPDQTHGQTDCQTDKEQTRRQEDTAATVDLGLGFLPIRSYKENDFIPVLIGRQEDGGRRRAAGRAGDGVEKCARTKGKQSLQSAEGRIARSY